MCDREETHSWDNLLQRLKNCNFSTMRGLPKVFVPSLPPSHGIGDIGRRLEQRCREFSDSGICMAPGRWIGRSYTEIFEFERSICGQDIEPI
jgi:hypothetical protein